MFFNGISVEKKCLQYIHFDESYKQSNRIEYIFKYVVFVILHQKINIFINFVDMTKYCSYFQQMNNMISVNIS